MTIPSPSVMHFRGGRNAISKEAYPEMERLLRGPRQALRQGHQGLLRCRLPLPAARRHGVGLSVLREGARRRRGSAARTPTSCRHLRQGHQHGAQVQARRHGDHHARVPRQLPLHLDLGGRLRAGGRAAARAASTTTAISWSTTASAPAGSSRCASCPRARSGWWSASSPPRAATLEKKDDIKRRLDEAAKYAPHRAAVPVAPVRLCLHRGGQRAHRGPAVGQAQDDRRYLQGSMEIGLPPLSPQAGRGESSRRSLSWQ